MAAQNLDEVISQEKAFQDSKILTDNVRKREAVFYSFTKEAKEDVRGIVYPQIRDKSILVLGCGLEDDLGYIQHGAMNLMLIDISPESISLQNERIIENGLQGKVQAKVMDAHSLEFSDESFDFVLGGGILHHLDLKRVLPEINRVLKPGGGMIFIEPLGMNPVINAYRRRTPASRTVFEHPLVGADIQLMKQFFPDLKLNYYYLTTFLSMPLKVIGLGGFAGFLWKLLFKLDKLLLTVFPFLGRFCWQVLVYGKRR